MPWTISEELDEFAAQAGPFLRERPAQNTIELTVIETLRATGLQTFGGDAPLFGWWRPPGGPVAGVCLQTPPYPLLLGSAPEQARVAGGADQDLLVAWFRAFGREAAVVADHDTVRAVRDRLGYGGLTLWEADGVPVSMAGLTRQVAGMTRVGPVYTPPGLRRRGYAGAVTAAASQAALDAGAGEVLLFTDLANPTSNSLYQRLGYHPVEDRVVLSFTADSP